MVWKLLPMRTAAYDFYHNHPEASDSGVTAHPLTCNPGGLDLRQSGTPS